jgi:hypothetical protein
MSEHPAPYVTDRDPGDEAPDDDWEPPRRFKQAVWAQGDCVLYEVDDPAQACQRYRRDMAEARIGVVTHLPDGIAGSVAWGMLREAEARLAACEAERNEWRNRAAGRLKRADDLLAQLQACEAERDALGAALRRMAEDVEGGLFLMSETHAAYGELVAALEDARAALRPAPAEGGST